MSVSTPERIARLPRDDHDRPTPWFLMRFDDGHVDYRFVDGDKIGQAVEQCRCWVCGERFERGQGARSRTFIVGPTALFTRTTGEPPMHRSCALYALRACPFLANPNKARRTSNVPDEAFMVGDPILDNPGVALAWMCRRFDVDELDSGGCLFRLPYPSGLYAYTEGLPALREQLDAAMVIAEGRVRADAEQRGVEPAEIESMVRVGYTMLKARLK
ncbi:MAG TPA: hypothetical protein VJM75_09200 [Acidimicrobiales bacterium]|nr:hypothetical protein [Acidimicrobiales bacterium]